MEPFIKPTNTSAGQAALDVLFPGNVEGAIPAKTEQGQAPAPSDQDVPAQQSELGDHGKLGEVPGEVQTQEQSVDAEGKPVATSNVLEIAFTDDRGRRIAKVDLSDTDRLKQLLPQAFGFRKMQAERDTLKKAAETSAPRLKELEENWGTLERTFQEGGIEGLVDLLGGKRGHYKEHLAAEITKAQKYQSATDAEKERMALEDRLAKVTREGELREKRIAEDSKRATTEREEAQLRSLESSIVPSFNKYRFAGTLGNESQEKALDQAIWDQAIRNLEALPEDASMTQELIDKEFRVVSTTFKAAIGKAGNAKAKAVIDRTKSAAQASVAAAASRSLGKPSTLENSMAANIKRGGLDGLTSGLMDVLRMGKR